MSSYIHNKKISSSEYFERIRKSGRDQFTVMPEFGVTVYDAINAPFDRDSNKPVYAHIPSRESQISKRGAYQANQTLTTMYKRKAGSKYYNDARFDAEFGASAPVVLKKARTELQMRAASQQAAFRKQHSLSTQVRRLIQGKKKDADASWALGVMTKDTFQLACLTAANAGALVSGTAATTTGLIQTDSDQATVNSVRMRGRIQIPLLTQSAANCAGLTVPRVRMLAVWFYKPSAAAAAGGALPPITEVLKATAGVDSLAIDPAGNAGRFSILSDRTILLNPTLVLSAAQSAHTGVQSFDYTVKVNKQVHFKKPPTDTNPGGHYDAAADVGQVDRGLLVFYAVASWTSGVGADWVPTLAFNARLNYTA